MQYVLLKHERDNDFHVDFLLDCGCERLLSWRICDENFAGLLVDDVKYFNLAELPEQKIDTMVTFCRRNFDHRRLYLEYEGEISENRGRVERVEWGKWDDLAVLFMCMIVFGILAVISCALGYSHAKDEVRYKLK